MKQKWPSALQLRNIELFNTCLLWHLTGGIHATWVAKMWKRVVAGFCHHACIRCTVEYCILIVTVGIKNTTEVGHGWVITFYIKSWIWLLFISLYQLISVSKRASAYLGPLLITRININGSMDKKLVTWPVECGMTLCIHSQTSMPAPLKFGNGWVISSHPP